MAFLSSRHYKLLLFFTTQSILSQLCTCTTFSIANYCTHPIWPGTLAGAGTPQLSSTGFRLESGQTASLQASLGWSGRIWARTGCEFDEDGSGICQTGDCGGRMECRGAGALPPTTLFEVTLGKGNNMLDFYDVSLVDGYNLPVIVMPKVQQGTCNSTGCIADLNQGCPKELQVACGDGVIACRSACEVFGSDQYCCSGEFANPNTCKPTEYSSVFKTACPTAYSYAFDDKTSIFTCNMAYDYTIVFCPPANGMESSNNFSVDTPIGTAPASIPIGTTPSTPVGATPTNIPIGTTPPSTPVCTTPTNIPIGTTPTSTPCTPVGTTPTNIPIGTTPISRQIGTTPSKPVNFNDEAAPYEMISRGNLISLNLLLVLLINALLLSLWYMT